MALEIERKFLVLDDSYKHEAFSKSHIRQGYICSERGRTVRIRIRDERAYVTIKGPSLDGGLARSEFEYEIPFEDGQQLMLLCEPGQIDKIRWLVKSGAPFHRERSHGRPPLLQLPVAPESLLPLERKRITLAK